MQPVTRLHDSDAMYAYSATAGDSARRTGQSAIIFVGKYVSETKGRSLEQIEMDLRNREKRGAKLRYEVSPKN
ncbi:hypothetical protein GCM10025859_17740 [Alicyclobacillus fastidiosus]|nr:hypothetical protein GCM10025859_17740 [Alicyclobacillus fastidiosus]